MGYPRTPQPSSVWNTNNSYRSSKGTHAVYYYIHHLLTEEFKGGQLTHEIFKSGFLQQNHGKCQHMLVTICSPILIIPSMWKTLVATALPSKHWEQTKGRSIDYTCIFFKGKLGIAPKPWTLRNWRQDQPLPHPPSTSSILLEVTDVYVFHNIPKT